MGVAYVEFALQHRSHFKVMWEGGISKEKYPEVGQTAYEAYLLLEKAALDLLPGRTRPATSIGFDRLERSPWLRHADARR